MPDNANTPSVRDTGATGIPENDKRDLINDAHAPKMSGAPERGKEPLTNKLADRNTEGPREAGTTPRPTDKPIVGGDRGA
jgi:hypothetical protein